MRDAGTFVRGDDLDSASGSEGDRGDILTEVRLLSELSSLPAGELFELGVVSAAEELRFVEAGLRGDVFPEDSRSLD